MAAPDPWSFPWRKKAAGSCVHQNWPPTKQCWNILFFIRLKLSIKIKVSSRARARMKREAHTVQCCNINQL